MPSTYSTLVSVVLPSSTVITPSLPTRSRASEINFANRLVVVGADRTDRGDSSLLVTFGHRQQLVGGGLDGFVDAAADGGRCCRPRRSAGLL